jgi:hypothetical protein
VGVAEGCGLLLEATEDVGVAVSPPPPESQLTAIDARQAIAAHDKRAARERRRGIKPAF